ncbi:MAG: hypothetical protein U0894_09710 [Pirellulales bacterium]
MTLPRPAAAAKPAAPDLAAPAFETPDAAAPVANVAPCQTDRCRHYSSSHRRASR